MFSFLGVMGDKMHMCVYIYGDSSVTLRKNHTLKTLGTSCYLSSILIKPGFNNVITNTLLTMGSSYNQRTSL